MKYKSKNIYLIIAILTITLLASFIGLKSFANSEGPILTEDVDINFSSLSDYNKTVSNLIYEDLAKEYDIEVDFEKVKDWTTNNINVNQSPKNKYELNSNPEVLLNILGEDIFYDHFKVNYINAQLMEIEDLDVDKLQEKINLKLEQVTEEILDLKEEQ